MSVLFILSHFNYLSVQVVPFGGPDHSPHQEQCPLQLVLDESRVLVLAGQDPIILNPLNWLFFWVWVLPFPFVKCAENATYAFEDQTTFQFVLQKNKIREQEEKWITQGDMQKKEVSHVIWLIWLECGFPPLVPLCKQFHYASSFTMQAVSLCKLFHSASCFSHVSQCWIVSPPH